MQVEEISAVDSPASPGASVLFWKRDFSAEEREKLAEEGKALSDGSYPIVTVEDLRNAIQAFGRADDKEKVANHIARRAKALDATDELPEDGKLAEMVKLEEPTMDTEELEKKLEGFQAVANAGPFEARYMADQGMDQDAKVAFMAKSEEDRQAVLKAEGYVESGEPEGGSVNKSELPDDVRKHMEDMQKRAEEAERIAKAEREAREFEALVKRVEASYPNLPKDSQTKAKVLKAIESADDEVAKAAREILESADNALASVYKERGVAGDDTEETAEGKLNKMASEKAQNEGVPFAKAYASVLETSEGMELYNQYIQEAR